jgi:chromosome segregation ATPase
MDEDGHEQGLASGDDNSSKMLTETIRMFFKMLEKSESRIDRTNMMIEKLVDACKAVELAYTSHVGSLQVSRDISQKSNARLIAANERMTRMMETARVDSAKERERYVQHIANLEENIRSLKDELHKATDKYWELMASYQRLAEDMSRKRSAPKAEVKIKG